MMLFSSEKQNKCSSGYTWQSVDDEDGQPKYIDGRLITPGPLTVFFSKYEYKRDSWRTVFPEAETMVYQLMKTSRYGRDFAFVE